MTNNRCQLKNMSGVHGFPTCHVGTKLFSLFSLLCPFNIRLSLSVFPLSQCTESSSFSKLAYEIEIKLSFKKIWVLRILQWTCSSEMWYKFFMQMDQSWFHGCFSHPVTIYFYRHYTYGIKCMFSRNQSLRELSGCIN